MTRLVCVPALGLVVLTSALAAPSDPVRPALPAKVEASVPEPLAVGVERNIAYATIDGEKVYLDLAAPKEAGKYPCVVMFHGGAWQGGSRRDLSVGSKGKDGKPTPSIIENIASRGYVVASVGYRLAPKHRFPAQIQDARASVRFLRASAKQYNIDADKFGACGYSAGGHIALLLGLADGVKGWDAGDNTEESCRVQCVVDFFGPTDLSLYAASQGIEDGYLLPVFGKAAKTDPEVYKKASPITYVSKTAPPTLILHGNFDLIVPIIHSENLLKKLQGEKVTAEMITVRGEGHGWNGPVLSRTLNDTVKFFDAHLKEKK